MCIQDMLRKLTPCLGNSVTVGGRELALIVVCVVSVHRQTRHHQRHCFPGLPFACMSHSALVCGQLSSMIGVRCNQAKCQHRQSP